MNWIIYYSMQSEDFDRELFECKPYQDYNIIVDTFVLKSENKYDLKEEIMKNFFESSQSTEIDCSVSQGGELILTPDIEFTMSKPIYKPIRPSYWAKIYFRDIYRVGNSSQQAFFYLWKRAVGCLMKHISTLSSCEEVDSYLDSWDERLDESFRDQVIDIYPRKERGGAGGE
jgi:hypothetical protein